MSYASVTSASCSAGGGETGVQPWGKRLSRAALRYPSRWLLRRRASSFRFKPDAVALVLAPHADDEVFGCGGLIARKRNDGQSVDVAYITDGSASHPNHPTLSPTQLKSLRAEEAGSALRILGVDSRNIHFLNARDGSLETLAADERKQLVQRINEVLQKIKPTEIFLPYRRDGSSEHEAAFRIVADALALFSPRPRLYEFPIWSWWSPRLFFRLIRIRARVTRCEFSEYKALKRQAISAYRSQTVPVEPWPLPVLPVGFADAFSAQEEFFFEIDHE